ncbi:spore-associated protein [Spiractinospora alimapuensis]|uniref:spore-associated protein n=1 Tax=Spiractinospora alimapuensis TaxID=2820884 RepID=UPI001F273E02|nr:spore-associated protein [Spiractinospora alimapuensis]
MVTAGLVLSANTAAYGDEAQAVQVCNSESSGETNYEWLESLTIPDGLGTVHLLWDDTTGTNCAMTFGSVSGRTYMDVGLQHTGGDNAVWDHGDFTQYAGPVYLEANFVCVDYTGAVGDRSAIDENRRCGGNPGLE